MTMTGTLYVKFYICIPIEFLFSLYVPLYVPRFIHFLNYLDCGGNFVGLDTYILWIFFFFFFWLYMQEILSPLNHQLY